MYIVHVCIIRTCACTCSTCAFVFIYLLLSMCLQYMLIPSFLSPSLNVIGDYVFIFVKISVCVFIFMVSLSSSFSQCIRRYLDRVWSPASIDYLDDPPVVIKEHTSSPPPPPAQFNTSDKSIEIKLNKQGGTSLGFSIAGGKGTVHIVTYTHTVTHTCCNRKF